MAVDGVENDSGKEAGGGRPGGDGEGAIGRVGETLEARQAEASQWRLLACQPVCLNQPQGSCQRADGHGHAGRQIKDPVNRTPDLRGRTLRKRSLAGDLRGADETQHDRQHEQPDRRPRVGDRQPEIAAGQQPCRQQIPVVGARKRHRLLGGGPPDEEQRMSDQPGHGEGNHGSAPHARAEEQPGGLAGQRHGVARREADDGNTRHEFDHAAPCGESPHYCSLPEKWGRERISLLYE